MSKEYVSITYENNIFYCTKNNTKWISVDGERWYGEEKRIVELENKIADIKANCDLAIEGRDIKIMELEKENAELMSDFRICEKNADTYYDQLIKAKEILEKLANLEYAINPPVDKIRSLMVKAEQFIKEIEK